MPWNNGYEKKKFEEEQKKLAEQYRKAGMSEEVIRQMYIYDLERFNNQRVYYERNQQLPTNFFDDDDTDAYSPLNGRFLDELSVSIEDSEKKSRYWWIEELSNPVLVEKIYQLSEDDKELLTLYVMDGFSQSDLSAVYGISQKNICKKLQRIKKFLKTGV